MSKSAQKTAAMVAKKWSTNLSNSTPQMQAGAQGVTTAPTQLAAANSAGYLQGVQNAVNSGRWQSALQSVTLGQWQQAYISKGIPRVQQAAVTDAPKVQTAFGPLLSYIYAARDAINASQPRGTLQQNVQRAVQMISKMAEYKTQ
jgi:hypothetical protein